ncbi:response regulator [Muricauda sp. JGD-17]|uniref:histidine kinase n=1 Tax=Flagellimonas ochracea TaxID=2696472 RepID=A0A964TEG1_9FLAO|nr:hybrid sensor histidine kinase/response regulator transcription factor [Allomuricauda ochracea]NAY93317.1 response regulator [Allomuricauda ochracea]
MLRITFKFLAFFLFCSVFTNAQDGTKHYRNIKLPQVNERTEVLALLQDSRGFMWFGTTQGLFRFDGMDFKRYHNEYGNRESLSDDVIYSLEEDSQGNVWIGTKSGGISILDPVRDTFSHHRYNPHDSIPFSNYFITAIHEDKNGIIWIGSQGGGLGKYDPITNAIKYFQKDDRGNSIAQNYITEILEDEKGNLWVGLNGGGINKFNPKTEQFQHFRFANLQDPTLNFRNNVIRDLYHDGNGGIWSATYGGFNKLNIADGTFTHYDVLNDPVLKSNSLNAISSVAGTLYITSYDGYFYGFDLKKEKFISSENINKNIRNGYSDRDGLYWLGLTTGEVMVISQNFDFPFYWVGKEEDLITSIKKSGENFICGTAFSGLYSSSGNERIGENILSDVSILCMEQNVNGSIWIGTNSGGLNIYDPNTGENKVLRFEPGNNKTLPHDTVLEIYKDEYGAMWVGTLAGLGQWIDSTASFLNRGTAQFKDMIRLDKRELWAATNIGIAIIDPTTNAFYMKQADVNQHKDSLLHNEVNVLYTPDKDSILIGSKKGLNVFIKSQNRMVNVHQEFDLPYGEIKAIAQDHHKNYWMTSDKGVLHIDLETGLFKYYDESNGLHVNKGYNSFIRFEPESNKMMIAGVGGYYSFSPAPLRFNKNSIPLRITDVRLFNQSIQDTSLLVSLKENEYLELMHHQDMVSFSYAGIDYVNPSKISYAYLLEGYNDRWIYTKDRTASFTNLEPGEYVFKVKSTNADGIWGDTPKSVTLYIKPPFWATWWAYALYLILFLGALSLTIRNFRMRERLKTRLHLEHLELEKLKEFSAMKSKFFANISHEFRTPLTLITGPIDDLMERNKDAKAKESLQIVKRNGQRLKRLIDQILDFSKLEAKKVEVKKEACELYGFLRPIGASFASLAEKNNIDYSVDIPPKQLWAYIDMEKIEMVLNNLISNALKFTPPSGKVGFRTEVVQKNHHSELRLRVEDNGPGLTEEEKKNVFERFYRIEKKENSVGTGIGLSLTKEIVDLMQGSIQVLGKKGEGSVFEVILPLELVKNPELSPELGLDKQKKNKLNSNDVTRGLNSILLVEDNEDLRIHFKNIFGEAWHILEATDGEMGYAMAIKEIPDLIISDLMMPKMDGNELCDSLKQDERTAHIPFIMLTAKASQPDKVLGLAQGANDYITKPFNKKELFLKVQNLLAQRKRMQNKLQRELMSRPVQSPELLSNQEKFILKLKKYIVDHLDDSEMNVNSLSKEMGYSRIQLYRKVLGLTGLSTSEFIRQIRIHKAAELLQKKWGNVSEIAYAVGFNNLSYFTKSFKEIYKLTPSQFGKADTEQAN